MMVGFHQAKLCAPFLWCQREAKVNRKPIMQEIIHHHDPEGSPQNFRGRLLVDSIFWDNLLFMDKKSLTSHLLAGGEYVRCILVFIGFHPNWCGFVDVAMCQLVRRTEADLLIFETICFGLASL